MERKIARKENQVKTNKRRKNTSKVTLCMLSKFTGCQLHEPSFIYRTNCNNNWNRAFDMFGIVMKAVCELRSAEQLCYTLIHKHKYIYVYVYEELTAEVRACVCVLMMYSYDT